VMRKEEAEEAPNVVMCTFSILTQPVDALFYSGATHSFISVKLAESVGLIPTHKSSLLPVILPDGKTVTCEDLYEVFPLRKYEYEYLADLYGFELTDFGIILGMDWLAKHHAQIDYLRRKIILKGLNGEKVMYKGQRPRTGVKLISVMKAHRLLGRGCEGFLCNVVKTEGVGSSLEDIPVAREFPDMFPYDISGMQSLRDVEFYIDQTPGATPIFRAPIGWQR